MTDPLEYPLALDALVGVTMAFKVKLQPTWENAFFVSIYEYQTVIKQILSPWVQELILFFHILFLFNLSTSSI